MKRTGLLLLLLSFTAWLSAQVVLTNDTLRKDIQHVALSDSVKEGEIINGDLNDLLNDEDLQPMDHPLKTMDTLKIDTLKADTIQNVKLDSLDVNTMQLIGMDVVMPDPAIVDSLGVDSIMADSISSSDFADSLHINKVIKDSLIMDQLVLDSAVIDTLKFDSAYYYKQLQIVKDSLRRDSIRLQKIAAEKRRQMIPLSIREFTQMLADYRREFEDLFETDYYELYEGVRMRPEFYKYVVPMTYYRSSIREAGRFDEWQPEDKYTAQHKRFIQSLNELVPDIRTSLPYYKAVEEQMLHFYAHYPNLVHRNEDDFANISLLSDKQMEATPRSENVLNMIGSYNTVEQVSESDLTVYRPNFWTKGGSGYLQFSQNHISDNWYKGGESTRSLLSGLVLFANFDDKQRVQIENKLEWKLGFITAPSDTLHSYKANNDMFRITSKLGLRAIKNWYYTLSADFKTQFFSSYQTNTDNLVSAIFSPAELNVGLGMDYKYVKDGVCNLSVLMNPFNYTLYTVMNDRVDPTKFNIEKGHKHANVFGSRFEANLKWKVFAPLIWESRLSYTTNYEKALAEWENTFTFVVNKYISTKLFVHARYDDGVKRKEGGSYFQLQEILSFGLNYTW